MEGSSGDVVRLGAWAWPVRVMLLALSVGCGVLFGRSFYEFFPGDGSFAFGGLSVVFVGFFEGLLFLAPRERFELVAARALTVIVPFILGGAVGAALAAQGDPYILLIVGVGSVIAGGSGVGWPILAALLVGRRAREAARVILGRP